MSNKNNQEPFDTQEFFKAETDDEFAAFGRAKKEEEPVQGEILEDTAKFQFDFDKYNEQSDKDQQFGKSSYKFSNKGIRAFSLVMIFVLGIATVFFAGFGIYKILGGGNTDSKEEENLFATQGLELRDTPSSGDNNASPLSGMNAKQAIANVSPAVVGIVGYSEQAGLEPDLEASGVIVNSNGYIVTNASVISSAMQLKVVLSNNEEYTAEKIGIDWKTDLAVIKIDAKNLTAPEFGKSSNLVMGEEIMVVGNPVDGGRTGIAVKGVVSAVGKQLKNYGAYSVNGILLDAKVTRQNTGGALVNMYGQVVGIVSYSLEQESDTGAAVAIPITDVNNVITHLETKGKVTGRIKLGATLLSIDEISSQRNSLPKGAYIAEIVSESNLFKKGARQGDVITHINAKEIKSVKELEKQFEQLSPGQQVTMSLTRTQNSSQERKLEFTFELEEE